MGSKPLDLASVLKKKIQPAFKKIGITGVGGHTFRHTVGIMVAEMGEHQLMIRDYLRHSDLHVTNKCLQATTKGKRLAQGKFADAILPGCVVGKQIKPNPLAVEEFVSPDYLNGRNSGSADAETLIGPKRTQIVFRGSL
jgi:hypothetical protein